MSYDSTLVVSIGRNIPGGGELTGEDWTDFQALTLSAVRSAAQVIFQGSGVGTWRDPETGREQIEDSFTVIGLCPWSKNSLTVRTLHDRLSTLATVYRQDAIALSWTDDTNFIGPRTDDPF